MFSPSRPPIQWVPECVFELNLVIEWILRFLSVLILGRIRKNAKATVSFIVSVCLPARVKQLCPPLEEGDFHEI
jgi:hypothetical protein